MKNKEFWESMYKESGRKPTNDDWLEKYLKYFESKDINVLDLGCGIGGNSILLSQYGIKTICCDFSQNALDTIKRYLPENQTFNLDMKDGLPFKNEKFNIVVADLSLHYFDKDTTKSIISEIKRVLAENGLLLGRVNSINDTNFGFGNGVEIEKNFFDTKFGFKRFFGKSDFDLFFSDWLIVTLDERETSRYGNTKRMWEFMMKKTEN